MSRDDDRILYVSPLRRRARRVERELQSAIENDREGENGISTTEFRLLQKYRVPTWARGVRVEHAGWFSWAVVATEERGH